MDTYKLQEHISENSKLHSERLHWHVSRQVLGQCSRDAAAKAPIAPCLHWLHRLRRQICISDQEISSSARQSDMSFGPRRFGGVSTEREALKQGVDETLTPDNELNKLLVSVLRLKTLFHQRREAGVLHRGASVR